MVDGERGAYGIGQAVGFTCRCTVAERPKTRLAKKNTALEEKGVLGVLLYRSTCFVQRQSAAKKMTQLEEQIHRLVPARQTKRRQRRRKMSPPLYGRHVQIRVLPAFVRPVVVVGGNKPSTIVVKAAYGKPRSKPRPTLVGSTKCERPQGGFSGRTELK
jgi:hypothetical protein